MSDQITQIKNKRCPRRSPTQPEVSFAVASVILGQPLSEKIEW